MSDRRRSWRDAEPAGTLCLTALTVVTVVSLCRLFPDWSYLRPMLVVAIGLHVVAAALRVLGVRGWFALPLLAAAAFELVALVYYGSSMKGPLPTGQTLDLMRLDLRLVVDAFPTAVAPVPSQGSFATATAMVVALCVILSDTFAFRAYGRVEAIVPTGVLFLFTAALGTDRNLVAVTVLWVATAILTVAVLRFEQHDGDLAWMGARHVALLAALPAIVVTAGVTAVAAGAVAPRLPGAGEKALIDTRNRGGGVTEVLSPLVDIRARMVNRSNLEMFTVDSDGGPHYWRMISVSDFNGSAWEPAGDILEDMGDRTDEVPGNGVLVTQIITVKNMADNKVPAAYNPVQVLSSAIRWAPGSDTMFLPQGNLKEGDRIQVTSEIQQLTVDRLRAATSDSPPSDAFEALPDGVPAIAYDVARQVTAGAPTTYDQMIALQNYFQNEFDYNLNVQLSNSNDGIEAFLLLKEGFCQQFAGTFAVMARTLGVPARVAVGYTPGDLGADGLYHVFGRHAHAWPEVWFDGIGWVAFEPTPSRGNADAQGWTGVGPAQVTPGEIPQTGGGNVVPGSSPTVSIPGGGDPDASTSVPGDRPDGGTGPSTTFAVVAPRNGGSGGPTTALVVFGLIALVIAWIVFLPRVMAARARRKLQSPHDRVVASWYRACVALELAGAPAVAGRTPLEYAVVAEREIGVDHRTMHDLAVHVTRAVYARQPITESDAARCETLSNDIDVRCRERMPLKVRLQGLVDPRMVQRRLAG